MLIRPGGDDLAIVGFYVGRIVYGMAFLILLPLPLAVAHGEWNSATALLIGAALAALAAQITNLRWRTTRRLSWSNGMVTVAISWLLGPAFLAVPLHLSGHYGRFLDAYFDAMSGLTTSGLAVIQDLDHLPLSMNLLRHITHFAGGQGIVVVVLSLLASSSAQIGTLYVGEGREERILPNIVRTSRFIYTVALVWLVVGTAIMWVVGLFAGLTPGRSLFHGVNLFMAAFDTGGFAPMSQSLEYYHSAPYEYVVAVFMVAGTLSFGLHYHIWRGRWREVFDHLESRTIAFTGSLTALICLIGLARTGALSEPGMLLRKGVITIISAHTGTGFTVVPPALYTSSIWGQLAPAAIVMAMAFGGMAGSTAGGIKAIRIGILAKSVAKDIRATALPPKALVVSSYHVGRRVILRDEMVRAAVSIVMLYLVTYLAGGVVGLFYGYPFTESLFESTSAAANVGLSVGITAPGMPVPLEVTYILQMWLGRLEFTAAFVLLGYAFQSFRGRT